MDGANNSTTFVDSSYNTHTISALGNAKISTTQSKFGGAGGSFAGAAGRLQISDAPSLQMGAGDFTIEFWIYFSTTSGWQTPFDKGYTASGALLFQTDNSGLHRMIIYASGSPVISETVAGSAGQWHHYALVRMGTTLTLYRNGVATGSATNSTNFNNAGQLSIAARAGDGAVGIDGFMDELRITKGLARYTSNFTPPTQPFGHEDPAATPTPAPTATPTSADPNFSSVSLLLHMDGANNSTTFVDSSYNTHTISALGNAKISTTQSKFGGAGGSFSSAAGRLQISDAPSLQMGAGDFTIEFWIYFSTTSGWQTPFDKGYIASGALLFQTDNSGLHRMIIYASGSAVISETVAGSAGQWHHYALVRMGTTLTLYRNGVATGSATNSTNFNNAGQLSIAARAGDGAFGIDGFMDELRITKGLARYTSNFTPPTAPFP